MKGKGLTDIAIRKLKPKEKHYRTFDSGGLYLEVTPNDSKLWRFKYRFDGKEKLLALGKYPDVPLLEARARRDEARAALARGQGAGRAQLRSSGAGMVRAMENR